MKRILGLLALSVLLLSSCQTLQKTARTARTESSLQSATLVDIEPATEQRVTHTMTPTKEERRGGLKNVRQAAEAKVLAEYNADLLLDPLYVITKKRMLFGSKVTSITVSGRPAHYKNFRTLPDSVWSNPAFRGVHPLPSLYALPKSKRKGRSNEVPTEVFRPKGIAKYIMVAPGFTNVEYTGDNRLHDEEEGNGFGLGALFSMGYQFSPYLFLGAGTGVLYEDVIGNGFIPLFANGRVNFSKKKNTLFLDYKLGYGIGLDEDGGLFGGVAWGYSFGRYDVAVQTLIQDFVCYQKDDDFDYQSTSIGVSFGFRF